MSKRASGSADRFSLSPRVFSCLSNAVLLLTSHPRGKDPFLPVISQCWHYLHTVSADVMQNDSPKSSVPLPDNSAGAAIKQKIPNHILLIPLVGTASVLAHLKSAAAEIPRVVLLQRLCKFAGKTLLLSLPRDEQSKRQRKHESWNKMPEVTVISKVALELFCSWKSPSFGEYLNEPGIHLHVRKSLWQ